MKSLATWTNSEAKKALSRYERMVSREAFKMSVLVRSPMIDRGDLETEGRIAVLEALQAYESYGVKESSWVRRRIQQRMMDAVRQADPKSRNERLTGVYRRIVSFEEKVGGQDSPTYAEIIPDNSEPFPFFDHKKNQLATLKWAAEKEPLTDGQRRALSLSLECNGGYGPRCLGIALGVTESRALQLVRRASSRIRDFISLNAGDELEP